MASKMNTFILNWQDPDDRRWYSVGKLLRYEQFYIFAYTRGAKMSSRFVPFGNMSRLEAIYVSETLFPIFANRVLNEKRPEFSRYATWSDLNRHKDADPLLLMARMGGGRATDALQVYPVPERGEDGKYRTVFFCHGISHLSEDSRSQCGSLEDGEVIYAMLDIQNPFDREAVALRRGDPASFLGYCPRYLAKDIGFLLRDSENELQVRVKRVNLDAPPQYRLLCEVESFWPLGFEPCSDEAKTPIVDFVPQEVVKAIAFGGRRIPALEAREHRRP
ncbi:MAG: HIRAN domain-containing protein [Rhizobium sp.]|nr:HIRAN domain-containing protein [Rhizobium sp.]